MNVDSLSPPDNNKNSLGESESFRHRCEARALLWQAGAYDLHSAVDFLERIARDYGIDADTAQAIMGRAFAALRDDLGGWRP